MGDSVILSRAKSASVAALPDFIREDHPKMVEFFKLYYQWMATQGADAAFESIKLNNDIDTSLELLLDGFRASFSKNFPKDMVADYRHFAKFLKEFYQAKGSEESFRIFFQAVFGESASVHLPRVHIFKPSNGKWNRVNVIRAACDSVDVFNQKYGTITGATSRATATIYEVVKDEYGTYLYYIEDIIGQFNHDEILVYDSDIISTVVPSMSIESIDSSSSWYDGDVIQDDATGAVIKVNKIAYGYIESLTIQNGGTGYSVRDRISITTQHQGTGFDAIVSSTAGSGVISGVQLYRKGFGYNRDDVVVDVISEGGAGAVLVPVFNTEFKKIKSASILNAQPYTNSNPTFDIDIGGTTFTIEPAAVTTVAYYDDAVSMLSGRYSRLHDSDYYQDHSYEIRSRADFKEHEASLKRLLHVAGTKQFGQAIREFNSDPIAEPSLI